MGYLAALHFLKHYQLYHGITLEKSTKLHFCDNSSLISQSPDAYKSAEASSFGFLKADYNVHMQIMAMIKEMDIIIPTQHVKGHQDDDEKDEIKLSHKAKLNIKVDQLATQAWKI
eukprot:scaffold104323_cov61-Attheya_sp.AAC.5